MYYDLENAFKYEDDKEKEADICNRKINMLQSAIEAFNGGVMIAERKECFKYDICYVSDGMCKMVGCKREDFIKFRANSIFESVHPDDINYIKNLTENSAYDGAKFEVEYRIMQHNGNYIWVRVKGVVKLDSEHLYYYLSYYNNSEKYDYIQMLKTEQYKCNIAIENTDIEFMTYDVAKKKLIISEDNKLGNYFHSNIVENVPQALYESSYILPESKHEIKKMYEKLIDGCGSASTVIWRRTKDKTDVWCERITCVSVKNNRGNILYIYVIGKDITALKKAQKRYEAILASRSQLEANSIACYRFNVTKNWCGDSIGRCERKEELLKSKTVDGFFEYIYDYISNDEMRSEYKKIFNRKALLQAFYEGEKMVAHEHLYKSTSGRMIWVKSSINLFKNPSTNDVEAILYAYDISHEKQRKQLMTALVNSSYVFVIYLELLTGAHTVYINGVSEEYYFSEGYDENCHKYCNQYISLKSDDNFINEISRENILKNLKDADSTYRKMVNSVDENNIEHVFQFDFRYLDYKDKQLIVTCSDVTEVIQKSYQQTKKLEKILNDLKKANKAKSDFLSRMSHDMRTPLNGIMGLSQIMLQGGDKDMSPEIRQNVEDIYMSGKLLLSLINDTLDMNKIESNRLKLNKESVDFRLMIRRIFSCIKPMADEKNINVRVRYINTPQCCLIMDKLRVQQILLNLISNAIKFTQDCGYVEVVVEQTGVHDDIYDIKISVKDNGIGISKSFMSKLFEPFEQENNNITQKYCGTGLGMSIVKSLVEMMGGKIEVKSEKRKGTDVYVYLSFKKAADSIEMTTVPQHESKNLKGKRILLCEDHQLNAKVVQYMLSDKQISVSHAVNGQVAVDMFCAERENYYDMILMDIRMPVMDGIEAAKRIRRLKRKDAATVPIIAMTANAYVQDIQQCMAAGMNAHIAKPVDMNDMYATIEKYMK